MSEFSELNPSPNPEISKADLGPEVRKTGVESKLPFNTQEFKELLRNYRERLRQLSFLLNGFGIKGLKAGEPEIETTSNSEAVGIYIGEKCVGEVKPWNEEGRLEFTYEEFINNVRSLLRNYGIKEPVKLTDEEQNRINELNFLLTNFNIKGLHIVGKMKSESENPFEVFPLYIGNKLIGHLSCGNREGRTKFTYEDFIRQTNRLLVENGMFK